MSTPFTPELLHAIHAASDRQPLLFGNARIITADPLIGDFAPGDLLLGGDRIVGIGPGLLTAADDDGALVIDCSGFTIVPLVLDLAQPLRPAGYRPPTAIAPGNPASFAILPTVAEEVVQTFRADPAAAVAVVIDGEARSWGGRPVEATAPADGEGAGPATPAAGSAAEIPESRLGTWIDENGFVHQHLTADGRYDETRGGREHAYQGTYWINGNRIDYRDDLGFWAFGEFSGDTLLHAGYTFHRA
ncbi:hypothetical protein BN1051_02794 [Arthrobacter saudimassiliensis]|uniref:Uncharacterized protein n=1 Tax=Arthrobacter saudimassiliensis TaxID=1461584 RepID=A0A078MT23_9MICC|nr:hypothetical protein BN1051_02794 [Arthrobacter saudimassiliensis]